MRITLRQLEVFAEVQKSGSTTQASLQLSLSQSAVSASLTDLENQLNVQLFDRVGKRLVTNEHGRLLYPKAVALLEQAGEIEQLFKTDAGALRFAASTTIGNYMLPKILGTYRAVHENTPLELYISNTEDVIKSVLEFRVDMGLIEGACHSPELITEPWLEDELVIFCSPDNPLSQKNIVTLDDLQRASWILRERGSGTREVLDQILFTRLPGFRVEMELGNSEAIKHAVRFGRGVSCLSRRVIDEQLHNGLLAEVRVGGLTLTRTLFRIYHRQKHISNALNTFLTYCR
ncbi:DNA-binding transcriptional regulator YeiE [Morganella psychrotolerans]|uniref:DNA-binding transcriptional regulator YeiE n=1 Tax=Morganella psychrotolerans TaxID=368603 RepID=UPI0039B0D564